MQDTTSKHLIPDLLKEAARLHQSGSSAVAREVLSKGLQFAPQEKRLYYALTEILLEQEQYQEALDIIEPLSSVGFDLRNAELKAECLERMQRYGEAQNIVNQILDIDQYSASALNLKGLLLYHQNELNEAAFYFEKSIQSSPTNGKAHINLALLRLDTGPSEAALAILKKGFILSPHIEEVACTFHEIICDIGALSEAEEMFQDAYRRYPMNKRLAYLLIDILIQQNKLMDAMETIEKSMAIFGLGDGILNPALKIRSSLGPMVINPAKRSNGAISLCMIVKNEEKNLARCLESVKNVVDEIVVVDTGSSDRTADVAKVYGAKTYPYNWHNDFSHARNFSLSLAKGAWIFILDADEVLAVSDQNLLLALTRVPQTEICAYRFTTRNYTNDVGTEGWQANNGGYQQEQAGKGWYPSEKVRFFPNGRPIRFENAVHELVEPSLRREGIPIQKSPIAIHHYGTLSRENEVKKKAKYYSLGKEKIADKHAGPAALIEHAIQAQEVGEYGEALNLWKAVLEHCPDLAKAFFNMSYSYIQLERYDKGLEAARKAMELGPNLKEAVLNLALCQIRLGETRCAIEHLDRLLNENPNHPMGIGLLAVAYCIAGHMERGLKLLDEIRDMGFNCTEYIVDHVQKLNSAGRMRDALLLVDSVAEGPHDHEKIQSMRGTLTRTQVVSSTLCIRYLDLKGVSRQIIPHLKPLDDYCNLDEQYFKPVENEKNADFIFFPYVIDPVYHHFGYEKFKSILRQLPFFKEYESKFVFFLMDDISPKFDIDSVIYRVNHDKRNKDKNSISLPYFVDDICQIPLSDKPLYHVNFIGTLVTHVLRAYMLLPLLGKTKLPLYDELLGKLDTVLAHRKNIETYQTAMAEAMKFVQQLFPLTPTLQGIRYFIDISVEQFQYLPSHIQGVKRSELVDIVAQSAATLCPRGFGVQSIRFFETLSAGRIPILISDHYVLPLENLINYSAFTWQVDETKISNLQDEVLSFFRTHTNDDLIQKAKSAKDVWEKYFAPSQISKFVHLTLTEVLKANYRLNSA
ncbi:hypothetical protein D1BOALGB6SA_9588 [Olavius sp. associated proteobacterium Delta 1]|nr:hypothetical protein D1BOALGB6SA_9588 [Olavius sp. associated proteobacterium Delta 1]